MKVGGAEATDAPPWLADFLLHPPLWFKALVVLAAGTCLALVVWRVLGRDGYISRDEQWSIALILGTIEGVALGVVFSIEVMQLGYAGDVLLGLVAGFVAVEALRRAGRPIADRLLDERVQLLAVWLVLVHVGVLVPQLAVMSNVTVPAGLHVGVGTVALCMLIWTFFQEFGPGETVGEALRMTSK